MRLQIARARQQELEAMGVTPAPLPQHAGELRSQAALAADALYRRLVLAASTLAYMGGTGVGQLPAHRGWLTSVLWAIAAAGLAARCIAPGDAWRHGVQTPDAARRSLRLLAVLAAVFAVLGNIQGGQQGVVAAAVTLATAAALFLLSLVPILGGYVGALVIAALAFAVPALHWGGALTGAAAGLAGLVAAALAIYLSRGPGGIDIGLALTRMAGLGWLFSLFAGSSSPQDYALASLAGAALLILDLYGGSRSSFNATIATVLALFFGASAPLQIELHAPLALHMPIVLAGFAILVAAGYRHTVAAMSRLPSATYLRAPRSVIPRLDATWGHPVEIYLV